MVKANMRLIFVIKILLFTGFPLVAGDAKPVPKPAPKSDSPSLPAGWLPIVTITNSDPAWFPYKKNPPPAPTLYIPANAKRIRGVFVCYVFHSQDPRELCDLWEFAMMAVPPSAENAIGWQDKRSEAAKNGEAPGHAGNILTWIDAAAKQVNRPELTTVPIVGWVGQNGGVIASDLYKRAPNRVLAWTDAWDWNKHPEIAANVPVANGWEANDRSALISKIASLAKKPTPPQFLVNTVTTYDFGHGIWSKYIYFTFWLDRAIRARMPDELPDIGKPIPLKPLILTNGWAGDFAPISTTNPIAPVKTAKGFAAPVWCFDEYTACGWRAFHSSTPDLELREPAVAFLKRNNYSSDLANGFGGHLSVKNTHSFAVETKGDYVKIEYYDGHIKVGESTSPPWRITGVKLAEPGVRALYAVGVRADGTRSVSRGAFPIVE